MYFGAGPCGLGAACHLHKLGYDEWQLFERNLHVSGLSASFLDDNAAVCTFGGNGDAVWYERQPDGDCQELCSGKVNISCLHYWLNVD